MWPFCYKLTVKAAKSQIGKKTWKIKKVSRQMVEDRIWKQNIFSKSLLSLVETVKQYWSSLYWSHFCCKLRKVWTWFIPLYKSSSGLLSSRHNYAQRWLNHIFSFARPFFSSMYCCFVTFSLQWISQVPTLFMTSLPHFFLSCYTIWQMDANCRSW